MRNLTTSEMFAVNGAQSGESDGYAINWWRAGFDVAGGAVAGTVLGGVGAAAYSLAQPGDMLFKSFAAVCGLGLGGATGLGVGAVAGAVFAGAREAWTYYNA